MPFQRSRCANLAHRPRPPPACHVTKSTEGRGADCKRDEDGYNVDDANSFPYVKTYPSSSSPSCCDDSTDWVIVQTDGAPCGDDLHIYGPAQELTATNVQLFEKLNNSSPSICAAGDNGGRRRCHRRRPKCRPGVGRPHASIATRESHHAESEQHLDPWAPIGVDSYEFDVFAVGAWAMEGETGTEPTYNYPRSF
ncbi:hypothetical protein J3459_007703 [Metarhizium acridum]|uniref:Uncharacterized protein n=1 Tax=Metarhizium acridum (strain CQMa 102) TaxID=655827 RepID=E9DZE4_METAQ|nr:uncharacterized protein MAC_02992 [Metarhizium acridum CQMa 102]EFY90876.1 hypothetical protein MAC_02992 [Metarhizium acridum CQMa 102]KAG8421192.1 hypothetical protein J3458_003089 [Metarhizium acridum]KAG8426926.1 hypothetical protein J3459_007703 [Metarhizium acridum]